MRRALPRRHLLSALPEESASLRWRTAPAPLNSFQEALPLRGSGQRGISESTNVRRLQRPPFLVLPRHAAAVPAV